MIQTIKSDYEACGRRIAPFSNVLLYRLGNRVFYGRLPGPIRKVLLLLLKLVQMLYSNLLFHTELPFRARIGTYFGMNHPYGVVFSEDAVLGDHCFVFHQVTIGANEHDRTVHNGVPVVGDRVYIGCGAKLIGGITVGSDVIIGANAVVTKDVPDRRTVVGNPARILERGAGTGTPV